MSLLSKCRPVIATIGGGLVGAIVSVGLTEGLSSAFNFPIDYTRRSELKTEMKNLSADSEVKRYIELKKELNSEILKLPIQIFWTLSIAAGAFGSYVFLGQKSTDNKY